MIHDRQYILARKQFLVNDTWDAISMPNGYILSYSDKLHISHNDDKSVLILGDVWQTDANRPFPHLIISKWNKNTSLDEIFAQENTWCGRFLLLTTKYIITDATASIGVFYGEGIVSSSLSLIHKIGSTLDKGWCPNWNGEFHYPNGINEYSMLEPAIVDYFPGPKTFYNNIKRLLPSEIYDYVQNKASFRPLIFQSYKMSDYDRICLFSKYYLSSIEAMKIYYGEVDFWLAISGGKDSRTSLAALERIGKIPYNMFTIYNSQANMTEGYPDYMCSKLLSRKLNKELTVLQYNQKNNQESIWQVFLNHNSGLAMSKVRDQYRSQLFSSLNKEKKVIILKNQIWELISGSYSNDNNFTTPQNLVSVFFFFFILFANAAEEYVKCIKSDHINSSLLFADRVYWDLRCGSWMADNMQGYDIFENLEIVQMFNCRRFIEILIGMNLSYRQTRQYEIDLIRQWCPKIKDIPYDDTYIDFNMEVNNVIDKVKRKVFKLKNKLFYAK